MSFFQLEIKRSGRFADRRFFASPFAVSSCGFPEFQSVQTYEMTFVTDVAALRRLIGGAAATLELAPAIYAMNAAMGIIGEGALPNQVAKLMVT